MNVATALAQAVVGRLVSGGVTDLVLAPGSRSAPLAFAAAEAVRAGQLRLHVRVDERDAAYLALGMAKVSGQPVAIVCTSGTAVANLLPAVVEASYSGIPLILLTADRPPNLRNVAANQTIDQVGIFGANARSFADVTAGSTHHTDPASSEDSTEDSSEEPSATDIAAGRARAAVGLALAAASAGHAGGPVHVNIGFPEPLVPDADPAGATKAAVAEAGVAQVSKAPRGPSIDEVLAAMSGPSQLAKSPPPARGVVIVGDVPSANWTARATALAEACGWPVLSEPSGNATNSPNAIAHFALLLGSEQFARSHRPELVITVGRFGISRPTLALVKSARSHIAVATPGRDRPDPLHSAAASLDDVPGPPALNPNPDRDPGWLGSWRAAAAAAESVIAARGASACGGSVPLDGPELARLVVGACDPDDLLLLAASRSVRDVADYAPPTRTAAWIIGNRGAAGIDGLISTAWGAALAHGGRTIALLGDLAFLHDTNGLLVGSNEKRPNLTIVVADNNGGGIFSSLEQGAPRFADQFEELFGTPHDLDLVAVARAHGAQAVAATTRDELQHHLVKSPPTGVIKVIVARLPDRAREAGTRAEIARDIRRAL